jgi:Flp pilus assembly pilin Flp
MWTMFKLIQKVRFERGQDLAEYALLLSLIAVAVLVAIGFLSDKINELFEHLTNMLASYF